jgi:hypothetical protein
LPGGTDDWRSASAQNIPMAKFKAAGSRKKAAAASAASNARAIPCLVAILGILLAVSLLFYFVLKG